MSSLISAQIRETCDAARQFGIDAAPIAVVLGSGLGAFVDVVEASAVVSYNDLPHFPRATSIGHAGRLVYGRVQGRPVLVLQGRCHLYEGHHWEQVTFPLHVLQAFGVKNLILSCAAGGLSSKFRVGDLMVIRDHLNFNMHRAAVPRWLLHRLPCSPFDEKLNQELLSAAADYSVSIREGVYIGVCGPNYETRAEQRMFSMFGDAIGMSTIPEAIVATRLGMKTCGLATITNLCTPDAPQVADGQHVIMAASEAEPNFRRLLLRFFERLSPSHSC